MLSPWDITPADRLWAWYGFLCLAAALNVALLVRTWHRVSPPSTKYNRWMRNLGIYMCLNTTWRSVFPSLYLQRRTFWDTPLNGILVDRGFACLGELAWVFQTAWALRHIDAEYWSSVAGKPSRSLFVQLSAWMGFALYVVAEGISYYNTATTNEWWAAAEVVVDGLSYAAMVPAAAYLLLVVPGHITASSGKLFLAILVVFGVAYPLYNWGVDAEMYMRRYAADQARGKQYFGFWEGLKDAAITRHPSHEFALWSGDMAWMLMYFVFGTLSSTLMMHGPSVAKACKGAPDRTADKLSLAI